MYDADLTIKGENGATADQFVAEVKDVNTDLNASWAKIKSNIPVGDQAAGEAKVRQVLTA